MARTKTLEEKQALYDGVSISTLATMFGKENRDVSYAIRSVKPNGMIDSRPVYRIKDVAGFLVDPVINVEEYLSKLNPKKLPPALQKDFWAAQQSKIKVELLRGEMWRTDEVTAVLSEVLKNLKQGILLFSDTVEARTDITEKQRVAINELADGLLNELHSRLMEGEYNPSSELEETDFDD